MNVEYIMTSTISSIVIQIKHMQTTCHPQNNKIAFSIKAKGVKNLHYRIVLMEQ